MNNTQIQEFMNAGLNFIPCGADKKPWVPTWAEYQYRDITPDEYAQMNFRDAPNVAIIAGEFSGNVECLDFDIKNDPSGKIWEQFRTACTEKKITDILLKCTIQETVTGGYHVIYRCSTIGRNEILALPKVGKEPIIETRGQGGYFVVYPSKRYILKHGSITNINEITQEERAQIMAVCRGLTRQTPKAPPRQTGGPIKATKKTTDTVMRIIAQLEKAEIDITSGYQDWVKIGHAIAHCFGEEGRDYFHRVSQFHKGYKMADTNKKYDNLQQQKSKRRPATIKSFFAIARDYGVDVADASDDVGPVERWCRQQNLRWNQVTHKIEDKFGDAVDDFVLNQMWLNCRRETNQKVSRQIFDASLFNYEQLQTYNPITEYFDNLHRTEVFGDPLGNFLNHLKLVNEDWKPFIKKWLIGVVASAYGHPSELILVLVGPQNNGKTEFFSRLLPVGLHEYYAVDKLDQGKDSDILMSKKLIINDDEFGGKSKKDAKHLKALSSRKSFSVRMPYGRVSKDLPRLAVLCGSSNNDDIVNDNTGNRRIIPVELISRNYQMSDLIDRDELWAQLVQEYFAMEENGWKLNGEQVAYLKDQSEEYQAVNPERELILKYWRPGEKTDIFMSASEVLDKIHGKHPGVKLWVNKLGQELTQLGFTRSQKKVEGIPTKGYWVRPLGGVKSSDDEVQDLPF